MRSPTVWFQLRSDEEERNDVISELEQKLRHNVDKDTKGQQNFENEIRLCQTLSRVVHPEHVDGAGQVLDGPVPHHDPPLDVEGVMSAKYLSWVRLRVTT